MNEDELLELLQPKSKTPVEDDFLKLLDDELGTGAPTTVGGYAEDVGKSVGSGLVKGAVRAPFLGTDIGHILHDYLPANAGGIFQGMQALAPYMPDSNDAIKFFENQVTPFYKPRSKPGQIAQNVSEFVPSAAIAPGGPVSNMLRYGLSGGIGSETGRELFKGTPYETAARIAGGILGPAAVNRGSSLIQGMRNVPVPGEMQGPPVTAPHRITPEEGLEPIGNDIARRTSHNPYPTGWYEQQFRGGNEPTIQPDVTGGASIRAKGPGATQENYLGPKGGKHQRGTELFSDYEPGSGRPTLRTSHGPRQPAGPEAPEDWYDQQFADYFAGKTPVEQMPQYPIPGTSLEQTHLPRARESAPVDPNIEAELALKFGGRSPTPMNQQPWMPQQNWGNRDVSTSPYGSPGGVSPDVPPIPGAVPVPQPPKPEIPTGGLASDLPSIKPTQNLPHDVTPAQADKSVTPYGDFVVGDYVTDAEGKVHQIKNLALDQARKPMANLDNGSRVPVDGLQKLQATNTSPEQVQGMLKKPAKTTSVAKERPTLEEPTSGSKVDSTIFNGIKNALKKQKGRVYYDNIMDYVPQGTTKSQITKALKEMQKESPSLVTGTEKGKGQYVVRGEGTRTPKQEKEYQIGKQFDKGLTSIRKQTGDTTYLSNFKSLNFEDAGSEVTIDNIAKKFNAMIKQGKLRVYGEESGTLYDEVSPDMFYTDRNDEDIIIEFVKDKK